MDNNDSRQRSTKFFFSVTSKTDAPQSLFHLNYFVGLALGVHAELLSYPTLLTASIFILPISNESYKDEEQWINDINRRRYLDNTVSL